MAKYDLAFIGAGNMAEAIARGCIGAKVLAPEQMVASDPVEARRKVFAGLGIPIAPDNREAAQSAAHVLLAVKPQQMADVLAELADAIPPAVPVISIAAGVSTARIEQGLGGRGHRVVRVMPNTPMLVGCGMSGLARGSQATESDLAWAASLFEAAGRTVILPDEKLMDAVTAVSGSGPAYFLYLIEWIVAGGCDEGLNPDDALELAAQACLGTARLLAETGQSPRELRRKVTSPGGTTQAACGLLDARGVAEAVRDAVRAAAARSRELGQ